MTKKQKLEMRAACDKIADVRETLEELLGNWTDTMNERSEKWQDSDKGQELQSQIDELEQHITNLEEVESFTDTLAES